MGDFDAVVIGAGPNGLAAAALAARAGWSVAVLEANDEPGGAVRSAALTLDGVVHDIGASFFPLARASPVFDRLGLATAGLDWRDAPVANAHVAGDGRTTAILPTPEETTAHLDRVMPGDGTAWQALCAPYTAAPTATAAALLGPLPPADPGAKLRALARLGPRGAASVARDFAGSAAALGRRRFGGEPARRMLAALALHSDLAPEDPGGGALASVLAWTAQVHGFPVPAGGAGRITDALVRVAAEAGAVLCCSARAARVVVRRGRAVAVRTSQGDEIGATRCVLATCDPQALFHDLVGEDLLAPRWVRRVAAFRRGTGVLRVDWVLRGDVPWQAGEARRAAVVHVADSVADMSTYCAQVRAGLLPERPYWLAGQPSVADPGRAPEGLTVLWGYCHVPARPDGDAAGRLRGPWSALAEGFADRVETLIGSYAPGFRDRVEARVVLAPPDLEALDANLVGGDLTGGSVGLSQQLWLRPFPGMGRYRTPIRGLYLGSASTHPGPGVHGACGANAWQAAAADARLHRI